MQGKGALSSKDASRNATIVSDIPQSEFAVASSDQSSIISYPQESKTRGPPTIMSEYPQLGDMTRANTVMRSRDNDMTMDNTVMRSRDDDFILPISKYSPAFRGSRGWS